MYWPLGAPKVYAASKHELLDEHVLASDDDADHAELSEIPADTNGSTPLIREGEPSSELPRGLNDSHDTPVDQQEEPKEGDEAQKVTNNGVLDVGISSSGSPEGIVGLQVTRSGHMFATITRSALTIWQTKVFDRGLPKVEAC